MGRVVSRENHHCWRVRRYTPYNFRLSSTHIVELGINFSHIRGKSMTVLNPMSRIDEHIMDDADLAGPIIYVFCFGMFLLLVRPLAFPPSDQR